MAQIHHIIPQEIYDKYYPHLKHVECEQSWNKILLNCHYGSHNDYTNRILVEMKENIETYGSHRELAARVRKFLVRYDTLPGNEPGLDFIYRSQQAKFNELILTPSGEDIPDSGKRKAGIPAWLKD